MVSTARQTPVVEFALEDPPTYPTKLSGGAVKHHLVVAFSEQVAAEREAHQALDALIKLVRRADSAPPPGARSQRMPSLRPSKDK